MQPFAHLLQQKIKQRRRWIVDGLVRIAVGLEHIDDIIADLNI